MIHLKKDFLAFGQMLIKFGGLYSKLFLVFVLISCSADYDIKVHLRELKEINPSISLDNWRIIDKEKDKRELRYLLRKDDGDTIQYLKFRKIFHDSIFNPDKDYYLIMDFTKEYISDSFIHFIHQSADTNYYYVSPINHPDSLIFIVGKYYYLCRNGKMSASQMNYFYQNEDSLKKVKGNNLPDFND